MSSRVLHSWLPAVTAAALAMSIAVAAAAEPTEPIVVNAKQVRWSAAPPSLPRGAKVAVIYGDPAKAGPYVMRLSLPANYRIPMHSHAAGHYITVVSGALFLGSNDSWDPKYATAVNAGGFLLLPANTPKFMFTRKPTVVEIHAQGPFDMNYVNPEDNPQKWAQDGKSYYFPSQYIESERKAPQEKEPAPSF